MIKNRVRMFNVRSLTHALLTCSNVHNTCALQKIRLPERALNAHSEKNYFNAWVVIWIIESKFSVSLQSPVL